MKRRGNRFLIFCTLFFSGMFNLLGQSFLPPGVDSVVITFVDTPVVSVQKAPLKYNKAFAMSFQMDDALSGIYNKIYPVFHGNGVTPGLTYTDGCGKSISFKMSSGVFIFSSHNYSDILNPDDPYHDHSKLTWPQLDTLYRSHWGIENHGLFDNPDAGSSEIIMYAFQRTESYARKKISDSLAVKSFVIPNNLVVYVDYLSKNRYHSAINQEQDNSWIGFGEAAGVNVESDTINWLKPVKLNRLFLYSDFKKTADTLYAQSQRGIHRWLLSGMHTMPGSFLTEMKEIYNTYGRPGKDDILMTTDDEILDYLAVKQAVQVHQILRGKKLTLTFSGDVPDDRLYYAMTLNVFADRKIDGIKVYGTRAYDFTGTGKDTALINLSWNGRRYPSIERLADSFTTLALASGSPYHALTAMDYVEQLPQGENRIRLQDSLCTLDQTGWTQKYDAGFCNLVKLGPDTTLCPGDSLILTGPENMAEYNWYRNGETFSNLPSVTVFPDTVTNYALIVKDRSGNVMGDTIQVSLFQVPQLHLGADTGLCAGRCLPLAGPPGDYHYLWSTGDTTSSVTVCPVSDTLTWLSVITADSCRVTDSVLIAHYALPQIIIPQDSTSHCYGDSVFLSVQSIDTGLFYRWNTGDTTASISLLPENPDTTLSFSVKAVSPAGCAASDTARIFILPKIPAFDIGPADTALCADSCLSLAGPQGNYTYVWSTGDTTPTITLCPVSDTTVKLTIFTPQKCEASDSVFIAYHLPPALFIPQDSTVYCYDDTLFLQAVSPDTGLSFLWNTGDTTASIVTRPPKPDTVLLYAVRAVSPFGCVSRDSARVFVRPQIKLKMDTTVFKTCDGKPVTLSCSPVQGDFISYTWFFDGNNYETETDSLTLYQPAISGWVNVTGTDDFSCRASDSAYLHTIEYVNLTLPADTGICTGDSLSLTGKGGKLFYWLLGNDTLSADSILQTKPLKSAAYTALSGDDKMCMVRDSVRVALYPLPDTKIKKEDRPVCMHTPLTLQASGAEKYLWLPDSMPGTNYTLTPADTMKIFLLGESHEGCTAADSLLITPAPLPETHFSGLMPSYCENDPAAVLNGEPSGGLFSGDGIRDSLFVPSLAGPGNHTVSYRFVSPEGCVGETSKVTYVYGPVPVIHLIPEDTTLHPGGFVQYDAGPGFDAYYWTTGATTRKVRVNYSDFPAGTDTIRVVAVTGGCSSVGKAILTFAVPNGVIHTRVEPLSLFPNPAHNRVSLSVPAGSKTLDLEIFDGWGKEVYRKKLSEPAENRRHILLDISGLKPGIYYVWLTNRDHSYFSKMIVQ
jgi:hypothetical protein